ncbi:Hypothetical protein CINCED_3A006946 [Cinara cedri]|uniref:Uncharacterized protein n=1 Tax=Cinara cedri TaxID=506608 RepID=A0A5E4MFX1_9HEMI|nr:Hypothetical protein CINCED_3A006946 [Cinara cedri]
MEDEGKAVREESARRPMILMYDVGRDIEKDRLGKLLSEQNPDLGIGEETVVPLFMKGPKTGDSVWWVCAVAPDAYQKVVGASSANALVTARLSARRVRTPAANAQKLVTKPRTAIAMPQGVPTAGRRPHRPTQSAQPSSGRR